MAWFATLRNRYDVCRGGRTLEIAPVQNFVKPTHVGPRQVWYGLELVAPSFAVLLQLSTDAAYVSYHVTVTLSETPRDRRGNRRRGEAWFRAAGTSSTVPLASNGFPLVHVALLCRTS